MPKTYLFSLQIVIPQQKFDIFVILFSFFEYLNNTQNSDLPVALRKPSILPQSPKVRMTKSDLQPELLYAKKIGKFWHYPDLIFKIQYLDDDVTKKGKPLSMA